MSTTSLVLQWLLAGAFAAVGVLTVADWLRHRDRIRRYLALSVGLLGLLAVLGGVSHAGFDPYGAISDVSLVIFLLSGWAFLRFRDTLIPLRSVTRWGVGILTVAVAVFLLVEYAASPGVTMLDPLQAAAAIALLALWALMVGEPAVRLWIMTTRLPSLQRARLRSLLAAYGGIVLVLALAVVVGIAPATGADLRIAITVVSFLVIPLFLVAFEPPLWVRRFWRDQEEHAFRQALNELLVFAADRRALALRAVEWAARLVGADAAMIATSDNQVLVTSGINDGQSWPRATPGEPAAPRGAQRTAPHNVIEVPLRSQFSSGVLAVRAGPLTPLFGDEEVQRLRDYANAVTTGLDRVLLTEKTRRAAELLDLAYNPIFTWSPKTGRIVSWNSAAEALYEYTAEEATGEAPSELLKSELPKPREEIVAEMRETLRWEGEFDQLTKSGKRITVDSRWGMQLDDNGEPDVIIEVNRDVTQEKRHAAELRRARDEAQRASDAKSEYLSRMSHELRTPLTAILGYSDLLELREPREDQLEAVDAIQNASEHLLSLVNDVLDIARIEAGRETIDADSVSLRAAIQECVRLISPSAHARGVTLSTDLGDAADAAVEADRQRLIQVLLNLVSNAVKYSGEGALVRVVAQAIDSRVRIEVIDTGPGLQPDQVSRLFQPFERLGAERTTMPGTGLGLALSKKLTEAMGGAIGVDSTPGRGSCFWIELQRAAFDAGASRLEAALPAPGPGDAERHTVLYVEDNLATIKLMEEVFSMRPNINMITALQGSMALELAREHQPDLVILDLHLPDLPGDEVLQQLLADPSTARIPVVMFSADGTERQRKRLLNMGARGFMLKPAKINDFLAMLDSELATAPAAART